MSYKMFIDDIRDPPSNDYVVVRSSNEALAHIKDHGMPSFISFDHDLGGDDTTMVFLRKLVDYIWNGDDNPPDYIVHSANPVGSKNIVSFMNSWKKATEI